MNLDFKKYKRIFAFGCSFTSYGWPTWADLIAHECADAEYFNYGMPGAGNILIASRVAEANKKYKFCDTDLVMIMWSTFCREDRWVDGHWVARGNIWNSHLYSDKWVKEFADPMGYMIRDHAIINMSNTFIKSLPCDNLLLKANPFALTEIELADSKDTDVRFLELTALYKHDYDEMPQSLYDFMGSWGSTSVSYYDEDLMEIRNDAHPNSGVYVDYLNQIGINLSSASIDIASESDRLLTLVKTKSELIDSFSWLSARLSKNFKQLF